MHAVILQTQHVVAGEDQRVVEVFRGQLEAGADGVAHLPEIVVRERAAEAQRERDAKERRTPENPRGALNPKGSVPQRGIKYDPLTLAATGLATMATVHATGPRGVQPKR